MDNNVINIETLREHYSKQYAHIDTYFLDGELYIIRAITRIEWKTMEDSSNDLETHEIENLIVSSCLIYPEDFDIDNSPAGLVPILAENIIKSSNYDSVEKRASILNYYRKEMEKDFAQTTALISEAFPNLTLEDIEAFDLVTTAKYLAQAEYKLQVLRQTISINYDNDSSIQDYREIQNTQHIDEYIEQEQPIQEEKQSDLDSSLGLTKEERLFRPRVKSVDKNSLAKIKEMHPNLVSSFEEFEQLNGCDTTPACDRIQGKD